MHYQNQDPVKRALETAQILETQTGIWKCMARKIKHQPEATDLTDEEVTEIETYLRGIGIGPNADAVGTRRYLMWRLAMEFGFSRRKP